MRSGFTRLTAVVIFVGAILGLVISIYGLYAIWTIKENVTTSLVNMVSLSGRTLNTGDDTLVVVAESLDDAATNLNLMSEMLADTAGTIGNSTGVVDDTAVLIGEDMPNFIDEMQNSLTGVQTTARLIDDMLGTITRIPLLGPFLGSRYAPEVPLNESVASVRLSLEPLPNSFRAIQRDMLVASASMATVQGELEALATQVEGIQESIDRASEVVTEYQAILKEFRARFDLVESRLPLVIDTAYLIFTVLLLWVGVSQLGALLVAVELLRSRETHDPA